MKSESMSKKVAAVRAVVYARTSRDDENKPEMKISIPQQLVDGRKKIDSEGWTFGGEYVDRGVSGTVPPRQIAAGKRKIRPELSRLLDDAKAGKVQIIVTRKLDRISRLATENGLALIRLIKDYGCKIVCTDDYLPDVSKADGELMLTYLLGAATYLTKTTSEMQKQAKALMKTRGLKLHSATQYGFKNGKNAKEIEVDYSRLDLVKEIFTKVANGQSLHSIRKWLMEEHKDKTLKGAKWATQTVKNMIRNYHLIGKQLNAGGELIQSVYPQIIDEALFYKANKILDANRNVKHGSRYATHLLSCIMRCKCGQGMVAFNQNAPKVNGVRPKLYQCKDCCRLSTTINEPPADELITTIIANVKVIEIIEQTAELIDIEKSKASLENVKRRFVNNEIEEQEYFDMSRQIKERIKKQEEKVRTARVRQEKEKTSDFSKMPIERQREIIKTICKSIIVDRYGIMIEFNDDVMPSIKSKLFHPKDFHNKIYFRYCLTPGKNNKLKKCLIPTKKEIMGYEQVDSSFGLVWSPIWDFVKTERYYDLV